MTQTQYTAVVTGGSAGIGEDICRKMLDAGYTVISVARNELPWTHERLHCMQVDLLDVAATEKVAQEIAERFEVTHFVHNAGVIWPALLPEVKIEDLQGLTQIHLGSAVQFAQAVLPAMRKRQFGRIILMSSRGILGLQTRTAYAATKAGLLGMARTWALELADQGITVNVLAPGPIQTNMFYDAVEAGSEREAQLAASIPVKRLGRVDDISRAAMFFADPENGFVTGQTLYVCGGASVGTLAL